MAEFTINHQNTGRGMALTMRIGEKVVSMLIAENISEGAKRYTAKVEAIFSDVASQAEEMSRDLTNAGLAAKLKYECARIRDPFQNLIETGVAETQQIARTYDRLDKLREPTALEPVIVQHFIALELPAKADFINRANAAQLVALLRVGREIAMAGQDPQIWQGLVSRYRRLGLIASYGLQAQFAGSATVDDPFAPARPDYAKAESAANELLKAVADDQEKIDNLKQIIQRVTQMVAVMCDVPVHRAWSFLTGEEAI